MNIVDFGLGIFVNEVEKLCFNIFCIELCNVVRVFFDDFLLNVFYDVLFFVGGLLIGFVFNLINNFIVNGEIILVSLFVIIFFLIEVSVFFMFVIFIFVVGLLSVRRFNKYKML